MSWNGVIWYGGNFYLELRLLAAGLDSFAFAKVEASIDVRISSLATTSVVNTTQGSGVILEQESLFIRGEVESLDPSLIQQVAILSDRRVLVEGTLTQTITRAYAQALNDTLRTQSTVILRKVNANDGTEIAAVNSTLTVSHRDPTATLGRVYTQSVSLSL